MSSLDDGPESCSTLSFCTELRSCISQRPPSSALRVLVVHGPDSIPFVRKRVCGLTSPPRLTPVVLPARPRPLPATPPPARLAGDRNRIDQHGRLASPYARQHPSGLWDPRAVLCRPAQRAPVPRSVPQHECRSTISRARSTRRLAPVHGACTLPGGGRLAGEPDVLPGPRGAAQRSSRDGGPLEHVHEPGRHERESQRWGAPQWRCADGVRSAQVRPVATATSR